MLSLKEYYLQNQEMVLESFQCNLFRELSKQFNLRIHDNKEQNEYSGHLGKDVNSTFKKIFSGWNIQWDKITEDRITEGNINDEKAIKKVMLMLSNRANSFPGMVILTTNNKDNWPKYTGAFLKRFNEIRYYSFMTDYEFSSNPKKLNEIKDYLSHTFYIVDLSNLAASDIQNRRYKEKQGSDYYTDKESRQAVYDNILKDNKRRYKEYTEKVRAQKQANDGVPEKVEEYMGKVTKLLETMSKDPIKYAKFEYDIYSIMKLLNGKREWHSPKNWKENGYYSGIDGLLTIYEVYIKSKLALARGSGSDSDKSSLKQAKIGLENLYDTIDKKLAEIDKKLAA